MLVTRQKWQISIIGNVENMFILMILNVCCQYETFIEFISTNICLFRLICIVAKPMTDWSKIYDFHGKFCAKLSCRKWFNAIIGKLYKQTNYDGKSRKLIPST